MAPLSLENATESLYNNQGFVTFGDCVAKSKVNAFGSFFIGFAGGVALQVHYGQKLPHSIKSKLVIPTLLGLSLATTVHRQMLAGCHQRWRTAPRMSRLGMSEQA